MIESYHSEDGSASKKYRQISSLFDENRHLRQFQLKKQRENGLLSRRLQEFMNRRAKNLRQQRGTDPGFGPVSGVRRSPKPGTGHRHECTKQAQKPAESTRAGSGRRLRPFPVLSRNRGLSPVAAASSPPMPVPPNIILTISALRTIIDVTKITSQHNSTRQGKARRIIP